MTCLASINRMAKCLWALIRAQDAPLCLIWKLWSILHRSQDPCDSGVFGIHICPGTLWLWFFLSESWGWRVMEVGKVVLGGGYEGLIASQAWDQYECQHPTMSWPQFIPMSSICHNRACNLYTKPIAKFRDVFSLGHPLYNPLWPSNSKNPFRHESVNFIFCKILLSMGIIGPKKWMTFATHRTYGHGSDSRMWGRVKKLSAGVSAKTYQHFIL